MSFFMLLQIPLKYLQLCKNSPTIFSGTYKSLICCVNNMAGSWNRLWKLTLRLRGRQGRCEPRVALHCREYLPELQQSWPHLHDEPLSPAGRHQAGGVLGWKWLPEVQKNIWCQFLWCNRGKVQEKSSEKRRWMCATVSGILGRQGRKLII